MSQQLHIDPKDLKAIEQSTGIRRELAKESFQLFFEIYFAHYVTAPMAWFHKEIFHFIEDEKNRFTTIMAFRWSGKSTIINTAFPIWSILGKHQNKFIVIVAQTQWQAKLYMRNLKEEILNNELLKKDLWPFRDDGDEFNSSSIVLLRSQARITVVSVDQSTRWMRHRNHRPELIIADDIEDLQSVKTREWRDKLFEWFTKELIPLGDIKKTRVFLVWNMLHRDSLLMRMRERIESGQKSWVFRKYPLLDEHGKCLWSERYTNEDIQELRETIWSEIAWRTEYLLEDAGAEWQVIKLEWIHWYNVLPERWSSMIHRERDGWSETYEETQPTHPHQLATGVDLAISESDSADYTAFVTGSVWGKHEHKMIYIIDAFKSKMDFPTTVDTLEFYHKKNSDLHNLKKHEVYIETVGYQIAMEKFLQKNSKMDIVGRKPAGSKRERLILISDLIRSGKIRFPNTEAWRMLVEELVGFGKERHDDLVDALTMMVTAVYEKKDHCFYIWTF